MSAALSGVLLFLAFLPFPTPHLVWVALAPWLVELEKGVSRGADERWGARRGVLLAGVFWALNLYWVPVLIPRLGQVWPLWGYLGQLLLLALMGGLAGAAIVALRRRTGLPLAPAAALGWIGAEWARGHLLGPLRFPWSPLALPLADLRAWVQPAAWVGESGLGLGIAAVSGLVASAWDPSSPPRTGARGLLPRRPIWLLAAGVVVVIWGAVGEGRLRAAQDGSTLTVGVVQPAVPLEIRRDPEAALAAAEESAARLLPELRGGAMDLVVLPETHFPVTFPAPRAGEAGNPGSAPGAVSQAAAALVSDLARWSDELEAEILVGGYGAAPDGRTNALLRITGRGLEESYGKLALVPAVERSPGGGLVPGSGPMPLGAPGAPGPLICIESAWSGLARRQRLNGAGWLLNVTNDGWLAGESPWTRTPAFRQHPRHLVLRSVESGAGAVRVGNTGLTGVVSPTGGWRTAIPPGREGVALVKVTLSAEGTPFQRMGDLLGPAAFMAVLVALLAAARRRGPPVDSKVPRI